jgi:hypothetical protein
MRLVEEAFKGVFPDKEFDYEVTLKYSGHFKGYNANLQVNKSSKKMLIKLSKQWRGISKEIKIGVIQEMFGRLFKKKVSSTNIDLYNIFIKQVHLAVPKTKTHPILESSFNRVNDGFFYGMVEQPNLGLSTGTRTLGHYDYGTDTITVTKHLLDHQDLLDYVMYHEILHKKHKFKSKNGRHYHHTSEFRKKEKEFPNADKMEKKLGRVLRVKKLKRFFGF